jgi:hypothetical protein
MFDIETFFLIDVPGGDRRYIDRKMTPERYASLKAATPGTRIFKVEVLLPTRAEKEFDEVLRPASALEVLEL